MMSERLRVNPIACDGSGLCAELLPEMIRVDEWGYPVVDADSAPPEHEANARRTVSLTASASALAPP